MNDTTGPLAVPAGGHYPAGWVSPEAAEHAQRQAVAWELAQEDEAAAKAARDQLISERLAERRGDHGKPVQEPAVDHDAQHDPVAK
jgi:hypothetical protein